MFIDLPVMEDNVLIQLIQLLELLIFQQDTVVACQDEKSQLKNKEKAMKVLRARLYEVAEAERLAGIAEDRKSQVGTGDRSERIRTYNYPQGRVTDHRIGLTLYKLDSFMNGDIEEVINALITADQAEKMQAMGNTDSI